MAPPVEVRQKARGKPRGMRRDRDCHSCRTRNIKCDLNRPSCAQCLEAKIVCAGYPQRVIWATERSARDAASPTAGGGGGGGGGGGAAPPGVEAQRQQRRASRPNAPGKPPGPSLADGAASGKTGAGMATTPTSTLAATCSGSPVLDLPCLPTDQNSFMTSLVAFCQHIISTDMSGGDRGHYLSIEAARLISQLHDLMKARIEGRAGAPLARGETWDSIETARHRLAVLIGLNEALEAANPFAFLGIAAFAVLEVCDSPFGEWQRHLHGAKSLLDYHCPDHGALQDLSRTVTGLTEIVARLVWFDTLGAIARGSQGLIFDEWHRRTVDQRLFQVVGCSADSFELFSKVASGHVAAHAMDACMLAMEQLASVNADDDSAWGVSANVNRCASAIAVLAQLGGADRSAQRAMAAAVQHACDLIASMSPLSIYYIHVAVPAYLAGMNATAWGQCEIIRTYWHRCNHLGVQRYPDGLAKCEERWKARGLAG
ncbi:hypothetical protein UVI_02010520 [Ustilaginoidea virens]|uniref:Zn(2)-C6 fungal-type domain-containing protein n=1 Tax=Ustilaginoidea virens TaxID=1159556 RepID=A0A1B5KWH1_USTVR|nr:hypothetical protein UVI_02010520 [Ustilaginoidea virens]